MGRPVLKTVARGPSGYDVLRTIIDAKGDLLVGTAPDAVGRLAAGAKGALLVPDATQPTGLRWLTGTPGDTLVWSAANGWNVAPAKTFNGTGNPNGTVAAPVGSVFRNTEEGGWNGAQVWRKSTGSGSTGWVVVDGNSGWRNVTALLANGWTAGSARLQRVADEVHLWITGLNGAAATGDAVYEIPGGLRPAATGHGAGVTPIMSRTTATGTGDANAYMYANTVYMVARPSAGAVVTSWPCDQGWQPTWPGTPA